jgi:hypothetical protein
MTASQIENKSEVTRDVLEILVDPRRRRQLLECHWFSLSGPTGTEPTTTAAFGSVVREVVMIARRTVGAGSGGYGLAERQTDVRTPLPTAMRVTSFARSRGVVAGRRAVASTVSSRGCGEPPRGARPPAHLRDGTPRA